MTTHTLIGVGILVLLGIGGSLIAALLVSSTQKQGKFGINLSPPSACPGCGEPLPMLRRPASFREAMWGGWTCKKCRLSIDKWGRPR
jgi:hypothetical protein